MENTYGEIIEEGRVEDRRDEGGVRKIGDSGSGVELVVLPVGWRGSRRQLGWNWAFF